MKVMPSTPCNEQEHLPLDKVEAPFERLLCQLRLAFHPGSGIAPAGISTTLTSYTKLVRCLYAWGSEEPAQGYKSYPEKEPS